MPAVSQVQQKAAALALQAKRGEIDPDVLRGAAKEMFRSMNRRQLEEFAETARKGLPRRAE